MLITVAFKTEEVPERLVRSGAAVTAKFDCGRRSIGYVWLHDLVDWVYREVVFRL